MSPNALACRRALRAACLSVLVFAVVACGRDPAPPETAITADGAAVFVCPSVDPAAFVAAFAEDPALQQAFTADSVETAFVDASGRSEPARTLSRDQLRFPVMPDRATQRREGVRQREIGRSDDLVTVVLETSGGATQTTYTFRRNATCWTLAKIAGRAFAGVTPTAIAVDSAAIMREVMRTQYGDGYDADRDCWATRHRVGGESIPYCLRPMWPKVVRTSNGQQLLFLAAGVRDFDRTPALYTYSATDPGLVGFFVVGLRADGGWSLLAGARDEPIGTNGDCACATARLMRLGRDVYGWALVEGGIWQGVTVSRHVVYAPVGGKVARVATVPDVEEHAQDIRHEIDADASDPAAEHYPLVVTARRGGRETGRRTILFDPVGGRYPIIARE
jgi:hypothetical protein